MILNKKWQFFGFSLALLFLWAPCAFAAPISAATYEMYNGNGEASDPHSYNYWDREYDGIGSVSGLGPKTSDHEYLSGGTGNLTDGVIPGSNYHEVENLEGTGPYVGWRNYNPVITFHFTSLTTIDTVNVFVDDDDGYGRVNLPSQVDITMGGITRTFVIPELV